jgi:uncharacterized protein DUF4384
MRIPTAVNRRMARSVFARSLTGLAAAALIFGTVAPSPTTGTETSWKAGRYADSKDVDGARVAASLKGSTRAVRGQVVLAETAVQRPRLSPGDAAALRALYDVAAATDVRETRIIRYDGLVLAKIERVVSRPPGSVESEYRVNVPKDAAEGWYSVTTVVEPAKTTTTRSASEQKETGFYIESGTKKDKGGGDAAAVGSSESVAIKLWADRKQYRIGERVTLSFETNRDAYVTLVDVGTSGEVTILFPNRFSGSHAVKAGKTYSLPETTDNYDFEIKGPPGVELVYALVTLKPVLFLPADFPSSGAAFQSMTERSAVFTRDINVAAKATPLREQAKATLELEISR